MINKLQYTTLLFNFYLIPRKLSNLNLLMKNLILVICFFTQTYADTPLKVIVYMEAQNSLCTSFIHSSVSKIFWTDDIEKLLNL